SAGGSPGCARTAVPSSRSSHRARRCIAGRRSSSRPISCSTRRRATASCSTASVPSCARRRRSRRSSSTDSRARTSPPGSSWPGVPASRRTVAGRRRRSKPSRRRSSRCSGSRSPTAWTRRPCWTCSPPKRAPRRRSRTSPTAIRHPRTTRDGVPTTIARRSKPASARSGTSSERGAVRIAVYCPHYEDAGGVQEVVRRLSAEMVAGGHAVHVVSRLPGGVPGALPVRDPTSGAEVSRVRFVRAPHRGAGVRAYRHFLHRFPASAVRLVRALRAVQPEVVATHCSKFHAPYVLAVRAALRVPIVVHLHNGPQTADGPESVRLSRLLLGCARRVIAVSSPVAEYARAVRPESAGRVVTVANGADQDEFAEVAPAARPRPYVLGAGGLAPRKAFDVLVDAFPRVTAAYDLVIAGDGAERAALASRAAD